MFIIIYIYIDCAQMICLQSRPWQHVLQKPQHGPSSVQQDFPWPQPSRPYPATRCVIKSVPFYIRNMSKYVEMVKVSHGFPLLFLTSPMISPPRHRQIAKVRTRLWLSNPQGGRSGVGPEWSRVPTSHIYLPYLPVHGQYMAAGSSWQLAAGSSWQLAACARHMPRR